MIAGSSAHGTNRPLGYEPQGGSDFGPSEDEVGHRILTATS